MDSLLTEWSWVQVKSIGTGIISVRPRLEPVTFAAKPTELARRNNPSKHTSLTLSCDVVTNRFQYTREYQWASLAVTWPCESASGCTGRALEPTPHGFRPPRAPYIETAPLLPLRSSLFLSLENRFHRKC